MSYDLYFTSPKISREQFYKYFRERNLYKVESDQAVYENEDTGVYFSFDYNEAPPSDQNEVDHSVSFNINYYRPSFFGLEAEPEIKALVEEFSFTILDYQTHGMGASPYTGAGFLEGWNHGNEFGYSSILQGDSHPSRVYAKSTKELTATWEWNFRRNAVQESTSKDIFVPRIFHLLVDGKLGSVVVWPDGISTIIPKVDFLFIPRKELAPRKLFRRVEDKCIIAFDQALEILQDYRTDEYLHEAYELPSPITPLEIRAFVSSLSANDPSVITIASDSILNLELVEKYNIDSEIVT